MNVLPGTMATSLVKSSAVDHKRASGQCVFDQPPVGGHVEYGFVPGDDYYVFKTASAFRDHSETGLPIAVDSLLIRAYAIIRLNTSRSTLRPQTTATTFFPLN